MHCTPPHYIGCLFDQGRGGNRNLFCCSGALWDACFVVVGLYIVCFMHVQRQLMENDIEEEERDWRAPEHEEGDGNVGCNSAIG